MNTVQAIVKQEFVPLNIATNRGPFHIEKKLKAGVEQYQPDGWWNVKENAKYAAFIKRRGKEIEKKPIAKLWNLFKSMASFVKSRNFLQCKSHHQKLYKQFSTIPAILKHLCSSTPQFQQYFIQAQMQLGFSKAQEKIQNYQTPLQVQNKPIIPVAMKSTVDKFGLDAQGPTAPDEYDNQDLPPQENQYEKPMQLPFSNSTIYQYGQPIFSMGDLPRSPTFKVRDSVLMRKRQSQWRECHELFILWTTKVRNLTEGRI